MSEVTHNGDQFHMKYWAGYTVRTGGIEDVYVVGYENNDPETNELALYRLSGSEAVPHNGWEDYVYTQYLGNYGGSAYSLVRGTDSMEYKLVEINYLGTVAEVNAPVSVRPMLADEYGEWFRGSNGGLWFRNVNEWQSVGIDTKELIPMDGYYLAGGGRALVEDGEYRWQWGIYKISMDFTSMYPQVELVWESEHEVRNLTYFDGNLYFEYTTSLPRELHGTLYIPYVD